MKNQGFDFFKANLAFPIVFCQDVDRIHGNCCRLTK